MSVSNKKLPLLFFNETIKPGNNWLSELTIAADQMSSLSITKLSNLFDDAITFFYLLGSFKQARELCYVKIDKFCYFAKHETWQSYSYTIYPWVALIRLDKQYGYINDAKNKLNSLRQFADKHHGEIRKKARLAYLVECIALLANIEEHHELSQFLMKNSVELESLHPHFYYEINLFLNVYYSKNAVISNYFSSLNLNKNLFLKRIHPKKINLYTLYAYILVNEGETKQALRFLYCCLEMAILYQDELRQAVILAMLYQWIDKENGLKIIEDLMISLYASTYYQAVRLILLANFQDLIYVNTINMTPLVSVLYKQLIST